MRKQKKKRISTGGGEESLGQPVFGEGLSGLELSRENAGGSGERADGSPSHREKSAPAAVLRLRRETHGRGGKTVIVITGLPSSMKDKEKRNLLQKLQASCATGGSLKGTGMEIQGDHREKLERILGEEGFRTLRAGG